MNPLVTTAEIAKMLKMSEEWVRAHARTSYRFDLEQVEAWFKQLEVEDAARREQEARLKEKRLKAGIGIR